MARPADETPHESAKFWRDPALGGVDVLRARFVTHAYAPHQHDTYALGVIEAGAEAFGYRGGRHVAPAGSVVVIAPGETHTGSAGGEGGWSYRMLYPAPEALAGVAAELGVRGPPAFRAPVLHDPDLAARLRAAHLALEGPAPALERETRLRFALAALVARHADAAPPPTPAPPHPGVRLARDLLEDDPSATLGLAELAARVGLSPFHLARRFQAEFGAPPHAYLLQIRARRAAALLRLGTPIALAAVEAGFSDQAHLSRVFKRVYGVPPGAFARGVRGAPSSRG